VYIKTKGIVIRETHVNDNDKLLTILTADKGKLTIKARGVKKQGSKASLCAQMFAFSEYDLYLKNGKYTLVAADIIDAFYDLTLDLEKISLANYFAQISDFFALEDENCYDILALMINSLHIMESGKRDNRLVKCVFELKMMVVSGYKPDLSACGVCNNERALIFNLNSGQLCCENCTLSGKTLKLTKSTLSALRFIVDNIDKKAFSFTLPDGDMALLAKACEQYLITVSQREFSALKFYYEIQ